MTVLSMKPSSIRLEHLAALHRVMASHQDQKNAAKLIDLYEKGQKGEFVIGFAGHFSAGKSSMINTLMGQEILPNSPVPTSADIVKVTSGEGVARIYFHNDSPMECAEPYDLDVIKEFCKNKDTIQKIELSTAETIIPRGCAIIDTPGVDAADETDRLITESSLHLVDVMVYVVDYNHVQSEENLSFLEKVQAMNIPFYLVINQIDKHKEEEIAFSLFEKRIKQTFDQWKIDPKGLYYTSLVDESHPHNQLAELQHTLFSFLNTDDRESFLNLKHSVSTIINDHKDFLKQSLDEEIRHDGLTNYFNRNDEKRLIELNQEIEDLVRKPEDTSSAFRTEVDQTLKNAYLMPADLRAKAESFLESQQKGFKVGFVHSKKKTSEEQEQRSKNFLIALQKSIEANLHWKLKDKLHQLLKEYELEDSSLKHDIQNLTIIYTEKDLLKLIKAGAHVNGSYVLNYTKDVSADIIQKYKRVVNECIEKMRQELEQACQIDIENKQTERAKLQQAFQQKEAIMNRQRTFEDKCQVLDSQLQHPQVSEEEIEKLNEQIANKQKSFRKMENLTKFTQQIQSPSVDVEKVPTVQTKTNSTNDIVQALEQTIQTIENLSGFASIVSSLHDKKKKLNQCQFTLVLFGAFSAGKSSFANALMGGRILPTSPNPTTAVINRIAPPTQEHENESVSIQMKNEETLMNDIIRIVKPIFYQSIQGLTDLATMIGWLDENDIPANQGIKREYQAFLHAVIKGYSEHAKTIGKKVNLTVDNFADYVTDEKKACYIEEVTLFYDCALTRQGITLVDTPGADSINARHTNVSFDYIKYADAITYITYYNHALSRPDKDFLTQLGRVKETFELDKMFFVINAADLAQDSAELKMVQNYVQNQLVELGIRFPQIYSLSSQSALEAQVNHKKYEAMDIFKQDFFNYIHHDLAQVIIQSALYEINRAQQTLSEFIKTNKLDKADKQRLHTQLMETKEALEKVINGYSWKDYLKRLEQKIDKQLYYVIERLSIRFHEMFKEMFNPTTITETSKYADRQLQSQMQQLLDYAGYELLQEVRAVSLRIEAHLRDLAQECDHDIVKQMKNKTISFNFSDLNVADWQTPNHQQAFVELNVAPFQKDLKLFKGTKAFFEKNEKEKMKEAIYQTLEPYIKIYIKQTAQSMKQSYSSQWYALMEQRKQQFINEMATFIDSHLTVTQESISLAVLEDKYQILDKIMVTIHKKEE